MRTVRVYVASLDKLTLCYAVLRNTLLRDRVTRCISMVAATRAAVLR